MCLNDRRMCLLSSKSFINGLGNDLYTRNLKTLFFACNCIMERIVFGVEMSSLFQCV
jgi:hypothetical protein